MGRKADNIRRALEAEGADEEEIRETLAEHDDEGDVDQRARTAGIPELYVGLSWEQIEEEEGNREAIAEARRWASGAAPDSGLFLWSNGYGNSKTMIAAAAAQQILDERPRPVRWLVVDRLMTDLNLSFKNPQYEKAADRLQPPVGNEVIVLDDLDKMPTTDRNIQPVYALINDCVNAKSALIITANQHLDGIARDFGDRFGSALASRLVGHCLDVEVSGRDRRVDP